MLIAYIHICMPYHKASRFDTDFLFLMLEFGVSNWEHQSVWWLSPEEFELDVGAGVDVAYIRKKNKLCMQFNYYN